MKHCIWGFLAKSLLLVLGPVLMFSCVLEKKASEEPVSVSGIYPHLAYYNQESECGTGAVVPWAGRLWVITYGPHLPKGSSDKLYEITPDLRQIERSESIGGTPANRMIHRESNQLFIGPYAIDTLGNVRVISFSEMPGRHTGNARHLFDPANKIYYATMEEGFYEVDVHSYEVTELYKDGNDNQGHRIHDPLQVNPANATLPGAHGKGLYSGQGVMVYSNNGEATPEALEKFDVEAGVLAEWDGKDWKTIRRNQFVEVTGPGGIHGNANDATDPIWTTGWDHKSLIVGVRDPAGWFFYRLPKASHSYDGAHGWNTEWPRIRDIGSPEDPDYLMTMHGMFWKFPDTFTAQNTAGIRPRSAYLKVIGDFTRWNEHLIFGCDDSAQKEFLNTRKLKGGIEGPGQSNSNLWFTQLNTPDLLGPNAANGALWLEEDVKAGDYSEAFLFSGWQKRLAWISISGFNPGQFEFEVDREGTGVWTPLRMVQVKAGGSIMLDFDGDQGEWIRAKSLSDTRVTLCFNYSNGDQRSREPALIFQGLASTNDPEVVGGLLYGLGNDRRALGVVVQRFSNGTSRPVGYYELDSELNLQPCTDPEMQTFITNKFNIQQHLITIDDASVLVEDEKGRRWRFPLGNQQFTRITDSGQLRICREVATERDLFNCHGTFYELPAENADGLAKVRPVASHNYRIHDYASYRGMLVMTGILSDAPDNQHIVRSEDGLAAVWLGAIDDLWKLGKPVGTGGPWKETSIIADQPSDPYLIGFYDRKTLALSHNLNETVIFTIEVEPIGHGPWLIYEQMEVKPGETLEHTFPDVFQARWIRFKTDKDCVGTAWLEYK